MNEYKKLLDFINPRPFAFSFEPLKIPYEDATLIEAILLRKPKTKFSTPADFYSTPSYFGLPPWHTSPHNPPGLLDDIWNKIRDVWHKLWELWDSLLGWNVKRFLDKILEALWHAYKQTHDFLRDPLTKLREAAERARDIVWTWIRDRGNWVRDRVIEARDIINKQIRDYIFWLRARLNEGWDWLDDRLTYWSAYLKGVFSLDVDTLKTKILTPIGGFWHTFTDAFKDFFKRLWDELKVFPGNWWRGIQEKLSEMKEAFAWPRLVGLYPFLEGWRKKAGEWVSWTWDTLVSKTMPLGQITPEGGPGVASIAAKAIGAGVAGLTVAVIAGELAGFWKHMGVPYLGAMFADVGSYRVITGAYMGAYALAAVRTPLTYYFNSKVLPYIPKLRVLDEAFRRRYLGDEEFSTLLKYHGIGPQYHDLMRKVAYRPLDPFSYAFLSQTGYFTPEESMALCRDMGYREDVIKFISLASMMWATSPFKTAIRHDLVRSYAEGYKKYEDVTKEILGNVKILSYEPLVKKEAETEYEYRMTKEKVDLLEDKFKKSMITEADFRSQLENYIIYPEKIDALVEKVLIKKYKEEEPETGKDPRKALKAELTANYKEGFITSGAFKRELEKAKSIVDLPTLYLLEADWRAHYDRMMENLKLWTGQYKKDLISEGELRSKLREYVPEDRKREVVIELARITKYKKEEPEAGKDPRKALKNELIANFKDGFISKATFERELEKAKSITDLPKLYLLEAQWRSYQERLKEGLDLRIDKFKRDIITEDEFRAWLFEHVVDKTRREIIVEDVKTAKYKEEEPEVGKDPRKAIRSELTAAFKEGYINQATFLAELEKARKITTIPDLYLMEAEWRKFYDETYEEIVVWRTALARDVIPDEDFRTHLKEMGIDHDKIERFIVLEGLKKLKKA